MRLLDSLRSDHEAIEAVALAFVTFVTAGPGGDEPADAAAFLRFFRLFAGRFHHGREEAVLLPALVRETEAAADRGPIPALVGQHRELDALLDAIERAVSAAGFDRGRLEEPVRRYVSLLLHHIDAENSVLLPESEARFRRVSAPELECDAPEPEQQAARDAGMALAGRYPPAPLGELVRGDGCPCCPSFGVSCNGVEREWSSDLEWEDMIDRVG